MKTKEQTLAWFKEQEWFSEFIKELMNYNDKIGSKKTLSDLIEKDEQREYAISSAFSWNLSKNGYNYWEAIDNIYFKWFKQQTKVCACCHRELPVEEFYPHKTTKDGLQPYCKECSKEHSKETYNKRRRKMLIGKVAEENDKKEKEEQLEKRPCIKVDAVKMIEELAHRGYYGTIYYRERKIETIEYNGHTGTFEYDEEHKINLQDFVEEKED